LHINQAKSYAGNEADYPFALNTKEPVLIVDRTQNIPFDYEGLMCVPLTFMDNFNRNEFEVVSYCDKFEKDEEKNIELKKKYSIAMERIKKQLLITPNDAKLLKIIKHPIANKVYFDNKNYIAWNGGNQIYYANKNGDIMEKKGFIVKNKPNKTIYIAPKSAPKLKNENPLLNNKIYFYTSPLVPDCICIGQTKGDVEKRVKQEFKNTPEKPYKILYSDFAQKAKGEWFTDKDFHKFLISNGFTNEIGNHSTKNEWFKIDIKTAKRLFEKFKKNYA